MQDLEFWAVRDIHNMMEYYKIRFYAITQIKKITEIDWKIQVPYSRTKNIEIINCHLFACFCFGTLGHKKKSHLQFQLSLTTKYFCVEILGSVY